MFSRYREQYEELWKLFLRPSRTLYSLADLGPAVQSFSSYTLKRTDFELKNKRNFVIKCSFFQRIESRSQRSPEICVLYLHSNSGSRLEALPLLNQVLENDMNLCCFDFSGCGLSEGEFISQGFHEKDDVFTVKAFLKEKFFIKEFALWGKGMGAVAAIHAAAKEKDFFAMVCDGPYLKLDRLALEVAKERNHSWYVINSILMGMVKKCFKKRGFFNIDSMDQSVLLQKCSTPILFVCSKTDKFIKPYNVEDLHRMYKGKKLIMYQPGDYNSVRNLEFFIEGNKFLRQYLVDKIVPEIKGKNSFAQPEERKSFDNNARGTIGNIKKKVVQSDIVKKFSILNANFDNHQGGNAFPFQKGYENRV